jgi:DNA-binding transcriptional LysR family regulator
MYSIVDLQQLRVFVSIAQEGNLTKASSKLCLSQPAVSAQLKSLEEELNVKLFERNSRGMVPTNEGRVLLDEANKVLLAAKKVSTTARSFQGEDLIGELRLGTISDPIILRLEDFFSRLIVQYPKLKLSMSQGISGDIIERVIEQRLDAGYVIGDVENSELGCIKIAPVTLRVVAPLSYRDNLKEASWQDVARLPWLSTPEKCSFRKITSKMFARHNVQPQTLIEADQESTLVNLVTAGVGMTLLREDVAMAAEANGKLIVWNPGIEVSQLNFIYLLSEMENPMTQAILAVLSSVWNLPIP